MPLKSPSAILEAACSAGSAKARLRVPRLLTLGFLAGAYVALGGFLAIIVGRDSPALAEANPGLAHLLFGAALPLGFVLVLVAGAELVTDNLGIVTPAWLVGAARWNAMLRNWGVVYIANLAGAVFVALVIGQWSGLADGETVGRASAAIAEGKAAIPWLQALLRGIGGNWLAVLAVWLALASDDLGGKILGAWLPITAFAALGLEHAVVNMFFIPLGMLNGANVTIGQFLFGNLLPVTIGNIIGGAGLVGAAYWWIYGRD